jgi:hypothetical protein
MQPAEHLCPKVKHPRNIDVIQTSVFNDLISHHRIRSQHPDEPVLTIV